MKSNAYLSSIFIALFTVAATAQKQDPQSATNQQVQHLMDVEASFEEMVPAGMSIEAKEVARQGSSGNNLVVQYHIFVKGAPPGTLFRQVSWPVNAESPSSALEGISTGKDGILMCSGRSPEQCGDSSNPDDPIEFTVQPIRGEPSRFAFVAPTFKIGIVIVPDPVSGKDKGCTLSAVRLTSKFELAFVSGTGYAPKADVHYRTTSERTNDQVVKSDDEGRIRFGLIPYPGNKSSGEMTVKVTEAKCSPEVSYGWGKF